MSRSRARLAAFAVPFGAAVAALSPAPALAQPDLRAESVKVAADGRRGSSGVDRALGARGARSATGAARTTVAPGTTLRLRATVRNAGSTGAGPSTTRFYLSPDPAESQRQRRASKEHPRTSPIDVLLPGGAKAGALARGRVGASRATVLVPETLAAGRFTLLACADDRGDVTERDESNQCTAGPTLNVSAATDALPSEYRSVNADLADAPDALLTQRGDAIRQMGCTPPLQGRPPASARAALQRIRRQLVAKVGAPAYSAFLASPDAATAKSATLSALASAADGNLGAALAAATRAAELAPRDADALRNAASFAVSAGMPLEALTLVTASAGRADQSAPLAGGIDRRAATAQIRGMALLQVGKDEQALRALGVAAKLDPALAMEAASGEAAQQLCKTGTAAALPKLRRAAQRRAPGTPPATPDLTRGRASHLRRLELPSTPAEAVRLAARYREVLDGQAAEVTALHDAAGDNAQAQHARTLSPVQTRRERSITRRINAVFNAPEHAARRQAMLDQSARPARVWEDFWGYTGADIDGAAKYQSHSRAASAGCKGNQSGACWEAEMRRICTPSMRGHHQLWVAEVRKERELADAYFAGVTRDVTALAAQLADPLAREEIRIQLAQLELSLLGEELDAWNWGKKLTIHERTCVQSPSGETPPPAGTGVDVSGAPSIDPGAACNAVSKNVSFVIDPSKLLEGVPGAKELPKLPKLKASCERIQVSYEFGKSAWLQPFVQIDWKFRAGTVTAFAGMRGKVELTGHAEKAKAGFYLTASKAGVEDFGWRLSTSVESSIGPVLEATVKQDFDLSFVPALQDAGALLGQ